MPEQPDLSTAQSGGALELDPRYVAARRHLLDALFALAPHRDAVIVAGAQAVYLHTGAGDIGIAPYTNDGDLALDPTLLGDDPQLETAMREAGFHHLPEPNSDKAMPGVWVASTRIEGQDVIVPVDLIVPEGVATGGGRRADLGPHGDRAARRVPGIEPVLYDHSTMTVCALDPNDPREIEVQVAGPAALLVAKAHKIHDRVKAGEPRRIDNKDGGDVVRLMQTTSPEGVGTTLAELARHGIAGPPTRRALSYLKQMFGRRAGEGVQMAVSALALAVPEERVVAISTAYVERMLDAAAFDANGEEPER